MVPQTGLRPSAPLRLRGGVMGESGRRVLEDSVLELPLGSCSVPLEGTTGEEEKLEEGDLHLRLQVKYDSLYYMRIS